MNPNPIWSDATLIRLVNDAEEDICVRVQNLYRRTSLSIIAATPIYTLPTGIISTLQVSWQGKVLLPLTQYILSRMDHTYLTNQSTPLYYSIDTDGPGTIRFYPVPNVTIATVANPYLLVGIQNGVIVSYFMSPSTSNASLSLPSWIARRLVKCYVCYRAFAQEGKGQNLEMSVYYFNKYESLLKYFTVLNANPQMARRRPNRDRAIGYQLAKPVYPANFGTGRFVDGRDV